MDGQPLHPGGPSGAGAAVRSQHGAFYAHFASKDVLVAHAGVVGPRQNYRPVPPTGATAGGAVLDSVVAMRAVMALTIRAASRPTPWIMDENIGYGEVRPTK